MAQDRGALEKVAEDGDAPVRGALLPDTDHNLTVDEVRVLWSFVHGDIMNGQTRTHLRGSWGLCDRHSWAHAVVEIELWQSGAGVRHGHQPFDLSILYDDLLETMIGTLVASHRRNRPRLLAGHGYCVVCHDLEGPMVAGLAVGYAGSDSDALTDEANQLEWTRGWLEETRGVWSASVCPACAGAGAEAGTSADIGARAGTGGTALRCRNHLIAAGAEDDAAAAVLIERLRAVRRDILPLIESMTQAGQPSTPKMDASWVEALGWFHGWAFPLAVTRP